MWTRGSAGDKAPVALVGYQDHRPCLGDADVDPAHADVGAEKDTAQMAPGDVVQLLGDVGVGDVPAGRRRAGRTSYRVVWKHRCDQVRRSVVAQLHDELTQVGLDHLDAGGLEGVVELGLLGDHRLRLGHQPGAGIGCDPE